MKLLPIVAMIAMASPVFAGTNVPPGQGGEVCQGSTCDGEDNGSSGNAISNSGNSNNVLNSSTSVGIVNAVENVNKNTNENVNKNINTVKNNAEANSRSSSSSISGSSSGSTSNSISTATGGAGGAGGTGGAGGVSSLNSTINVSSSTSSAPRSSRVETVGIAPDISSYSTAPCRVAIGASGGWLGGALGFTGSVLDEGCDVWRDHVNLSAGGHKDAADLRLCDKPELKKLLSFCVTISDTKEANSYTAGFRH